MPCFRLGFHINYINEMPFTFQNITDYVFMFLSILINEIFHDLCDLARKNFIWDPRGAPHDCLVEQVDDLNPSDHGFNLLSYKE